MRFLLALLGLFSAAFALPAVCAEILILNEFNSFKLTLQFRPLEGYLVLCEGAARADNSGCVTKISDMVTFFAPTPPDPTPSTATMDSDAREEDEGLGRGLIDGLTDDEFQAKLKGTEFLGRKFIIKYVEETVNEKGVEQIDYNPENAMGLGLNGPGFGTLTSGLTVAYRITSDDNRALVSEPSTLLLLLIPGAIALLRRRSDS